MASSLPSQIVLALVRGYRALLSPLFPPVCRYYPTCSQYMMDAVQRHGSLRGLYLGILRILRCHPFHPGGYDPVPASFGWHIIGQTSIEEAIAIDASAHDDATASAIAFSNLHDSSSSPIAAANRFDVGATNAGPTTATPDADAAASTDIALTSAAPAGIDAFDVGAFDVDAFDVNGHGNGHGQDKPI